ncbi:MAG: TIGR00730 family Rossman fold protein [Cyanobacteria bacterium]|nr:TIGR00730 family Rossman fold protein [Cyanobacteriota bacterium]
MIKRICVFCGALPGKNPLYREAAVALGEKLVECGIELVYGGGKVGLMGVVADAVLHAGGHVIGVIPEALLAKELGHKGISDLRVVKSMHERKALMSDLSDAFIALPGGFGTLDELFEVVTWLQLGAHDKPSGLLNIGGYYDHMLKFLDHVSAEGFLTVEDRQILLVDNDPGSLIEGLRSFVPRVATKWVAISQT